MYIYLTKVGVLCKQMLAALVTIEVHVTCFGYCNCNSFSKTHYSDDFTNASSGTPRAGMRNPNQCST